MSGEVESELGARVTERVRELAKEQGYRSDRALAAAVGKSHQWLGNLYNGKKPYDFGDLHLLARTLGTTAERLLPVGPSALPAQVQRLVDQFSDDIMAYWNSARAGQADRRALVSVVREAWRRGVRLAMEYWQMEVDREAVRETSFETTPSRPRRRRS